MRMANLLIRRILALLSSESQDTSDLEQALVASCDNGAFAEAHRIVQRILRQYPQLSENGDFCVLRADLELAANDDVSKAKELLERARALGCVEMNFYHIVRGDVMWQTGDLRSAIYDYEQSVALDPAADSLFMLAQAYSAEENERALEIWEQFLEKEPDNCFAHVRVGMEATKAGDRGKGLLMAKRAERSARSADDIFYIAGLYHQLREYETAIDMYLKANRLGYRHKGTLYASIAACHVSLGEAKPAREYAEWARRCDPESEDVKRVWQEYVTTFGKRGS